MNWPHGDDLNSALDFLETTAAKLRGDLPFITRGYQPAAITQRSEALGRPVPAEIAAMCQNIRGVRSEVGFGADFDYPLFLYELPDTEWLSPDQEGELEWLEEEYPAWFSADYFAFGQGIFGDRLVYCPNAPERPSGTIILLDHEGLGPEESPSQPCTILILADSLAQWIARWTACGFYEYGYVPDEDIPGMDQELQHAVRSDMERLNPGIGEFD